MRPDNTKVFNAGVEALGLIKTHVEPAAFIGGGWARDYYLDLPIRDVDVWLPNGPRMSKEAAVGLGFTDYKYFESGSDPRVERVIKVKVGGVDVDLIYLNDPSSQDFNGYSVCGKFPFGIQQIFWDGDDERLRWTELFEQDVSCKTLTFNPVDCCIRNLHAIQTKNLPKMKEKFSGYKVNDPEGYLRRPARPAERPAADKKVSNNQGEY